MLIYRIYSYKYNIDLPVLLLKHLNRTGTMCRILHSEKNFVEFEAASGEESKIAAAVCELILSDISPYHIGRIVGELPLSEDEKNGVFESACIYAANAAVRTPVIRELTGYFKENRNLVIEGFILFRMTGTLEIWERCVEKATEEVLLISEQEQLAKLLFSLVNIYPEPQSELTIVLKKDGSCTVSDKNIHTDYPGCDYNSVIGLIASISPQLINIYNLTGNENNELIAGIEQTFTCKINIFTTVTTP